MNVRVLVAALAGAVAMFLLGWLIFGVVLMSYMKAHTVEYAGLLKDPPDMIPLFLANLAWAWLIAFVFDSWAGIKSFGAGLKGGALIMLPLIIGIDLQFWSFMNLYKGFAPLVVDVVAGTVMGALTGGVIALVIGMFARRQAAD